MVERSEDDFTTNDSVKAGDNLFYSFGDFSVPADGSATFNNASDVVNIFDRVTGGNVSHIELGLIIIVWRVLSILLMILT